MNEKRKEGAVKERGKGGKRTRRVGEREEKGRDEERKREREEAF